MPTTKELLKAKLKKMAELRTNPATRNDTLDNYPIGEQRKMRRLSKKPSSAAQAGQQAQALSKRSQPEIDRLIANERILKEIANVLPTAASAATTTPATPATVLTAMQAGLVGLAAPATPAVPQRPLIEDIDKI